MSEAEGFGPPIDQAAAIAIARRFLLQFWNDTADPRLQATQGAYQEPVWRITAPQSGNRPGVEGTLSFDIDGRMGIISQVSFR